MMDHSVDQDLVDTAEAAEMLGIGQRMFQIIVQGGAIAPYVKRGNQQLFKVLDVQTLKELRKGDTSLSGLIVEARRSAIESRALRKELDLVKAYLGINFPMLSLEREEVVNLVLRVEDAVRTKNLLSRDELLEWARIFHGVTEAYLEAVALYVDTKEPWRGFVSLGWHLCTSQPQGIRNDRELEGIYAMVHAGVRIMRQASYFYVIATHGRTIANSLFREASSTVHDEVLLLGFVAGEG